MENKAASDGLMLRNNENQKACTGARQAYAKVCMEIALYAGLVLATQLVYRSVMVALFGRYVVNEVWYPWVKGMVSACLIAFPIVYLLYRRSEKTTIEQKKMTVGQFLCCMLMSAGILLPGTLIGDILFDVKLVPKTGGTGLMTGSGAILSLLALGFCLPIVEELIFRKFLIDRVQKYGEGIAILTSGLLFGLYQENLSQLFFATGLGAFFAYIYIRTGKVWYTMVLHIISNLSFQVVPFLLYQEIDWELVNEILAMDTDTESTKILAWKVLPSILLLAVWIAILGICALIGIVLWIVKRRKMYLVEAPARMEGKRFRRAFGNLGIVCFLLLLVANSFVSYKMQEEKKKTEHEEAWIADIDGPLRNGLKNAAGVREFLSAEKRNARLDELIRLIETGELNDDQITLYIQELISDLHIGHMSFQSSSAFKTEDYYSSYLLAGKWFSDGFYISATLEEYKECIGAKLIAINDIGIDEVLSRYDRIYSNETESFLKYRFESNSSQGFHQSELEYLEIIEEGVTEASFTFEKNGTVFTKSIEAVKIDGSQELSIANISSEIEELPYGEAVYRSEGYPPFYYEIDKENRALYLQYNECTDATYKGEDSGYPYFAEFFDRLIEDMKENEGDIDCFVLDLRNNLGGSEVLWNDAVAKYESYLEQYPIKLLIGKATFSAAVDAIDTTLLYFDDVTLYGEETGLAVHNYTAVQKVALYNTGSVLGIPTHEDYCHVIHKRSKNVYKGVMPDVEVVQTFEGYVNGIDEVYRRAVSE